MISKKSVIYRFLCIWWVLITMAPRNSISRTTTTGDGMNNYLGNMRGQKIDSPPAPLQVATPESKSIHSTLSSIRKKVRLTTSTS